jgi:(1->4)-alpha-D-glucan 1-alpha-D-glucosylmutase
MAKGVEDTAFYRYFRLAALNEVGGNPAASGSRRRVPRRERGASRAFPLHLLTTFTHDTKRSPDVRSRHRRADLARRRVGERVRVARRAGGLPTRARSYLVYQTLVGACRSSVNGSTGTCRRRSAKGR